MKKEYEQKIKCNVYECKHCNCNLDACKLSKIDISTCDDEKCDCKEGTMCANFEKNKENDIRKRVCK